jgi:hypothetical protein
MAAATVGILLGVIQPSPMVQQANQQTQRRGGFDAQTGEGVQTQRRRARDTVRISQAAQDRADEGRHVAHEQVDRVTQVAQLHAANGPAEVLDLGLVQRARQQSAAAAYARLGALGQAH